MKRAQDLIFKLTIEHNEKVLALVHMATVDWASVPVDTLVEAHDNLNTLIAGRGDIRHFKGIGDGERLYVFAGGTSKATSSKAVTYEYMRLV